MASSRRACGQCLVYGHFLKLRHDSRCLTGQQIQFGSDVRSPKGVAVSETASRCSTMGCGGQLPLTPDGHQLRAELFSDRAGAGSEAVGSLRGSLSLQRVRPWRPPIWPRTYRHPKDSGRQRRLFRGSLCSSRSGRPSSAAPSIPSSSAAHRAEFGSIGEVRSAVADVNGCEGTPMTDPLLSRPPVAPSGQFRTVDQLPCADELATKEALRRLVSVTCVRHAR